MPDRPNRNISVLKGIVYGYFLSALLPTAIVLFEVWSEQRKPNPAPDAAAVTIVIPLFFIVVGPIGAVCGAILALAQSEAWSNPLSSSSPKPLLIPAAHFIRALGAEALHDFDRSLSDSEDSQESQELRCSYLNKQISDFRDAAFRSIIVVAALALSILLGSAIAFLLLPVFLLIAVLATATVWRMRVRVQRATKHWDLRVHPSLTRLPFFLGTDYAD